MAADTVDWATTLSERERELELAAEMGTLLLERAQSLEKQVEEKTGRWSTPQPA